ncbi:multidrug effflux MFS transporter [Magnetovibrio sp.]|uniref:multidrug effflux MFS transporter n=1 Tax=Magnetovibrio sp. TaxID=2024836 RepID=UPI002F94B74E
MRLQPQSFSMAILLTALVSVAPLSTDMYLPALPAIGRDLQADAGMVQLTLSAYLIGFAGGQLILGPLSDRFGRRPVLLAGLMIFVISSIACLLASNITMLLVARLFQAVGACAGTAISRAVVRDIHGVKDAARMLAHMGTAMATAPLIAPLIGGHLTASYGWQANFVVLAGIGALMLVLSVIALPETHTQPDPLALSVRRMARNYSTLLKNATFRDFTLSNAFGFAGLFGFISSSSFILIDGLGMRPETFGFAFAVVVLGYMSGTQVSVRLLKNRSLEYVVGLGGRIALVAGIAGLLTVWLAPPSVFAVIVPIFCYNISFGIIMPNTMAGGIGPFPHMAGTASALMGFVQMALAAFSGALVGHLYDGTALPMMAVIAVTGTLAWLFAQRVARRGDPSA